MPPGCSQIDLKERTDLVERFTNDLQLVQEDSLSTPQYAADDLKVTPNLMGGLLVGVKAMVPMLLHDVLRNTAADVTVLVGETGGGKTLSILAAAYEYGIMFYYKCNIGPLQNRQIRTCALSSRTSTGSQNVRVLCASCSQSPTTGDVNHPTPCWSAS